MDYNIILGKSTLTNVSDAYSGTLNVSYSQYTNNGVYLCKIDTTNTTISPTLSLNGLTAYPIKRNDGTSILVGELKVDAWYLFMFDQSTSTFEILNLSIPYLNGTTNYVAKYTPTGNVLGLSQIFDNGTNVGIGTATPTSKLQIVGTDSTSSNYSLKIDNSASSPLLYVRNDGNVGIGTATPDSKLVIKGSDSLSTNYGLKVQNSGGTNSLVVSNLGSVGVGNTISTNPIMALRGLHIENNTSSYLSIGNTNSAKRLVFGLENGDFNYQLVFGGGYLYYGDMWNGSSVYTKYNTSNGDWLFSSKSLGGGANVSVRNTDAKVTIVGYGTDSSGKALVVNNVTTGGTYTESPLLVVRNDGNVGIGTSTPSEKLEVNGNIKTAQPSANGAGAWKLGKKVTATVSLVTTDYIEVEIDSVVYKLALVS